MSGQDPAPMARHVLRRASEHLDALAEEVHLIEHAIGEELAKGAGHEARNLTRLQRLDFLRQSLEDLALLSLLVSQHETLHVSSETVAKLRLGTTKWLIEGAHLEDSTPVQMSENGEVDLF